MASLITTTRCHWNDSTQLAFDPVYAMASTRAKHAPARGTQTEAHTKSCFQPSHEQTRLHFDGLADRCRAQRLPSVVGTNLVEYASEPHAVQYEPFDMWPDEPASTVTRGTLTPRTSDNVINGKPVRQSDSPARPIAVKPAYRDTVHADPDTARAFSSSYDDQLYVPRPHRQISSEDDLLSTGNASELQSDSQPIGKPKTRPAMGWLSSMIAAGRRPDRHSGTPEHRESIDSNASLPSPLQHAHKSILANNGANVLSTRRDQPDYFSFRRASADTANASNRPGTQQRRSSGPEPKTMGPAEPGSMLPPPVPSKRLNKQETADQKKQSKVVLSEGAAVHIVLSDAKTFRKVLDDPIALWKFGRFLAEQMSAEPLVFWLNSTQLCNDLKSVTALTKQLHRAHVPTSALLALNLSDCERATLQRDTDRLLSLHDPFAAARATAFDVLHKELWPKFIKHRLQLLNEAKMHLESASAKSLKYMESFCITDASAGRYQPIVACTDAFVVLTGYSRTELVGKDCRFLQGPGTSNVSLGNLSRAIAGQKPVSELLLNYTKSGQPFWNFLRLLPLFDETGACRHFLGHQINASALLTDSSDLSTLLRDDLDDCDDLELANATDGIDQTQPTDLATLHRVAVAAAIKSRISTLVKDGQVDGRATRRRPALAGRSSSRYSAKPGELASPDIEAELTTRETALARLTLGSGQAKAPDVSSVKHRNSLDWNLHGIVIAQYSPTDYSVEARRLSARQSRGVSSIYSSEASRAASRIPDTSKIALESPLESYVIVNPCTHRITFTSSQLCAELAHGVDFAKLLKAYNPAKVYRDTRDAFQNRRNAEIHARLRLRDFELPRDGTATPCNEPIRGQISGVRLIIRHLTDKYGQNGLIVVLFQ
ncbi:uncharacterized protein L969DRAFT_44629 [Mixia osmundae IAM 14324]|uniref:RGS domain-containing protein n=1 Tax=Mixia osmundae (strain CBS 9802 / IAM 14324 / JCM 22182 / KY 12970) TaxID=764103 RepID=G7DTV2_MIXOS|nr:uncharacterized protein L969DRAFT_44629 [Mixia osmundae IAM 14324]KEI41726.1 hypothetical protein L969DRAFT_44629 [Mixia osmundae IAM 14324]GAA94012.1 hypothetical protein E5Q_00659 [Mixia osmundae IAM 14324]